MNELEEMWSSMIARARENALTAGRHDVADYLDLKAANDLVRKTGVDWLFATLMELAAANGSQAAVEMERTEPHSFQFRGANIVGVSLGLRYGLRRLTVEAGWTRTPTDGFMRGGGLAFARFRHFGIPQANLDAALFHTRDTPVWRAIREEEVGAEVRSEHLERHMEILLKD
jgi:hypothetical protein